MSEDSINELPGASLEEGADIAPRSSTPPCQLGPGASNAAHPGSSRPILHLSKPSRLGRVVEIQIKVCAKHGIGIEEMLGDRRHKHIVRARWEAICRAYYETGLSTTVIGRQFNRDHTSILYALGRIKRQEQPQPQLIRPVGEQR